MAWYRAYPGMAADPKFAVIAKKIGGTSRAEVLMVWLRVLEHTCERGNLNAFKAEEEAVSLGLDETLVTAIITAFTERDMIDGVTPKKWNARQYKSDVSTERVQRHRENVKRSDAVTATSVKRDVTPPDTDTDTDTDSESERTVPSERKRARKVPLPEISELDSELRSIAVTEGIDADREFANCRDWCLDNSKPLTAARVRRWFRNPIGKAKGPASGPRNRRDPRDAARALAQSMAGGTDGADGHSAAADDRRGRARRPEAGDGSAGAIPRGVGAEMLGPQRNAPSDQPRIGQVAVLPVASRDRNGTRGTARSSADLGEGPDDRGLAAEGTAATGSASGNRPGTGPSVAQLGAADPLAAYEASAGSVGGVSASDGRAGETAGHESDPLAPPSFMLRPRSAA